MTSRIPGAKSRLFQEELTEHGYIEIYHLPVKDMGYTLEVSWQVFANNRTEGPLICYNYDMQMLEWWGHDGSEEVRAQGMPWVIV